MTKVRKKNSLSLSYAIVNFFFLFLLSEFAKFIRIFMDAQKI